MLNSLTVNRALSISDVKTRANQKAGYLIDAICDTSSAAVDWLVWSSRLHMIGESKHASLGALSNMYPLKHK